MFGYVLPFKPEMKIKEYDLFRAYYCGVCKAMDSNTGIFSRLTLNYDSVFLGVFLSFLNNEKPEFAKEACIANPIKKKLIIRNSESVNYAANINIILTHYKLIDNWNDERDYKSYFASILQGLSYNKARRKNEDLDKLIFEGLSELNEKEKYKCGSIDEVADVFARLLSEILVSGVQICENINVEIIRQIGYDMGRWIYLIDAFDDLEKDQKSGSFNVFLIHYAYLDQDMSLFKEGLSKEFERDMLKTMARISEAVEELEIPNKNIIRNIVYEGMHNSFMKVIRKGRCDKHEESL